AAMENHAIAIEQKGNPTTPTIQPTPDNMADKQSKLKMLLDEFKRQRAAAVARRDALLKEGRAADDPDVQKEENIIRRADGYIPMVEDIGAQKGVAIPQDAATQP